VTLLDVGLLFVALMLISFTLGATVMWSWEGRDRRWPPLWLVITRHVSQIALVAYLVVSGDPPTGVITIDPFWWNLLEAFLVVASLVIFPLEIRQRLRYRNAT
jgi:hypothetical protein